MKPIREILKEVEAAKGHKEKSAILLKYNTPQLRDMLYAIYSKMEWEFTGDGAPPYEIPKYELSNLYKELKQLKFYAKNWTKFNRRQKEYRFVNSLQRLSKEDGELLIDIVNKVKFPYITKPVIKGAFPNLIKEWA